MTLEKQSTIQLNTKDHEDMLQMMTEATTQNKDSSQFQRLFWEQQLEAAKKHKMQGMRWHPLITKLWYVISHRKAMKPFEKAGFIHHHKEHSVTAVITERKYQDFP